MRTCSIDGCTRKHRARGLCGPHYNQAHQPDRHKPAPAQCDACGATFMRRGGGSRGGARRPSCSLRCRYFITYGRWPRSKALVGPLPWTDPPAPDPKPEPTPRRWVSGPCAWCGSTFTVIAYGTQPAYCSDRCLTKAHKVRRRALERGATGTYTWAEVMRIYLDIGGCAYCNTPTDDVQPDRVVPLSRGGSNSITNVVPCCRPCNTDKRSLLLHEWYADRSQRGKPARQLNPKIRHLTHALVTTG